MARIKLTLPSFFPFSAIIPVRVTDLNYGGHVGNDALLSLIHEARMQYLQSLGYSEMSFSGASLIMADVAIEFKAEAFYGDLLTVFVAANDFSRVGFDLYYKLIKQDQTVVAIAKTGMICFDYKERKVTRLSAEAIKKLSAE